MKSLKEQELKELYEQHVKNERGIEVMNSNIAQLEKRKKDLEGKLNGQEANNHLGGPESTSEVG